MSLRIRRIASVVAFPTGEPDHFRWCAVKKAQLAKIVVFGENCEAVIASEVPDIRIGSRMQANRIDLCAAGEGRRKLGHQPKAEIFVKQQLHAA